jgi:hypothetical protein
MFCDVTSVICDVSSVICDVTSVICDVTSVIRPEIASKTAKLSGPLGRLLGRPPSTRPRGFPRLQLAFACAQVLQPYFMRTFFAPSEQ